MRTAILCALAAVTVALIIASPPSAVWWALTAVVAVAAAEQRSGSRSRYVGGHGGRAGRDIIKDLRKHPRSHGEAAIIGVLERITGWQFPSVYPAWLTWAGQRYELDGYNAEHKLALEYDGPWHTKWISTKEPYVDYFARLARDVAKRRLCARHGVTLIVVDYTISRDSWHRYINSRLHDAGLAPRPPDYTEAISCEPYRNLPLEAEIGLGAELEAAKKL